MLNTLRESPFKKICNLSTSTYIHISRRIVILDEKKEIIA